MALNPATLTAGIETAIAAAAATAGPASAAALAAGIAAAVIAELTTNAEVVPIALVAPAGGGPVTGTGKIT